MDFLDDPLPINPVTIRIKNAKNVPIYLGGDTGSCGPTEMYGIADPSGPLALHAGGCGYTCEALQQHDDVCPDSCFLPPTIYIAPGGTYEETWSGTSFPTAQMPSECYFNPEYAYDSCYQRTAVPTGAYVATAVASDQLTCLDVGICSCEPDAKGSCQIPYGGSPSGQMLEGKVSFTMPATGVVEIVVP
jgi:hypothetical protein